MLNFPDPRQVSGEGNYNLINVKEIDGTEAFLNWPDEDKNCQNRQSILECKEEKYLQDGRDKCNCIPYNPLSFSTMVREGGSLKTRTCKATKRHNIKGCTNKTSHVFCFVDFSSSKGASNSILDIFQQPFPHRF